MKGSVLRPLDKFRTRRVGEDNRSEGRGTIERGTVSGTKCLGLNKLETARRKNDMILEVCDIQVGNHPRFV